MTYKERQQAICKECNIHDERCAYFTRNIQDDCPKITSRMVGWELGYKDAIDKVHKWINEKWDVAYTHPLVMDAVHKELDEFMEEQQ